MSNRKNLANGILALGVNTTDTTWVLQNGYGAGMPDVPFYLTATPFGQLSTMGNSEIVNVTARTGDTLTIERAQKETTARSFSAGDIVSNGIYAEDLVDMLYPVGSTYFNKTNPTNPATLLGFGTWARLEGVVLGGRSEAGGSPFNVAAGTVIGADTHTLTIAEMPAHDHNYGSNTSLSVNGTMHGTAFNNGSYKTSSQGGGKAHNNIQRTLVGYLWERTA